MNMYAIDWLAKYEDYSPHKIAIVEVATGWRFTYREFNRRANQVCRFLQGLNVNPGDRTSVLLPNGADVLFTLFGASKAGSIFVPFNYKLAARELAAVIEDAEPSVILYSREFQALVTDVSELSPSARFVCLEDVDSEIAALPDENPHTMPVDVEAPQMLLYTAGSTGKPKGVILSHRMILWNSVNTSLRMLALGDTVLVHTPMFYTGGLNVYTLPNFYLGGTVVIMKSFQADELLKCVEREGITGLFGIPTQLLMMADSEVFPTVDLSRLRFLFSGGAPCPVPLIERYAKRGITLQQGFGLTEVGPNCFALEKRDYLRKAGSIGYPNFAMQARLVDDDGREIPVGETGELALRSPAMCSGYWRNPEQTRQAIRDGWFFTGDMASQDADGCFYIVGRKKDMFISGGENVYPAEVEAVLRSHPKIADTAVVGVPHPKWVEVGSAAIVLKRGEQASDQEILAWCAGKIGKYKIPKGVLFINELPRMESGKINKVELKQRAIEAEAERV
jgi:fatty-acyl-CoA synthase